MTTKKLVLITLFTIHCSLFTELSFAQDLKKIDSLHNELRKFDAHKIELGSKATLLMDSAKADILYGLVVAYYGTIPDSANLYSEELKSLSAQIGYKKGIGNYYNGIGLINLVKARNFPLAEESFQRALKIRTDIGDKEGVGWTYNNMGNMYGGEGNMLESIKYHGKAFQVFEELGKIDEAIGSLTKRSAEFINIGNYPDALKDAFHALKLANEHGLKISATVALDEIGGIYEREGNYGEALKNFTEVAKLFEELGDNNGLANSNQVFGNIYLLKGDTAEALKSYNKALKRFSFNPNGYFNLQTNLNIGNIYFYKGKYDEALKYYFDALKISEVLKEKNGLSIVSIAIAKVYNKQGKYQEALRYVNIALEDGLQRGQKDEMKDSYKTLSEIYSNLHDYKAAYKNQTLYQQMKDTILNVENTSKMKQLEMQYEFDKDAAIQKAEQDNKNAIAANEIASQKFKRNAIYGGLAIIVVFLLIVILQRNKISKERRLKALEQERSRISQDLHDDLGSGLAGILMLSSQLENPDNKFLLGSNIQKIKQSSELMTEQMDVIIWALNPKNDTLENLLSFIEIYMQDYFENLPVKFIILLPSTIPFMMMSGIVRRNIFLVIKESLSNTLKHAQATTATMEIKLNEHSMEIIISDNGSGFDMDATRRFGNGLKNMKSRIKDIKGTFAIESIIGQGTKTFISFPIQ